ncbi:MAG: methyltransferase domain-containing protein [Bacteroidota bacterium]
MALPAYALQTDVACDALFPFTVSRHAFTHFTPVGIIPQIADFLAPTPGTKVLDIGSGAGKFCLVAASVSEGHFTGVERRKLLHRAAVTVRNEHTVSNTHFILQDIVEHDFSPYDAFFLFNPFYENFQLDVPLDNSVPLHKDNFLRYANYVKDQLAACPAGTRVATYYSFFDEIPQAAYRKLPDTGVAKLFFWEKE